MGSDVQGFCPMGCGPTLFLGSGGHVTCRYLECPEPAAVSVILADREVEHVVEFGETAFTVRHPLRERLRDELMHCQLHTFIAGLAGPPVPPGRYRAVARDFGWEFLSIPDSPDGGAPSYLAVEDLGGDTFYGVTVCAMGEDGDRVVAFTHDLRRAIAAVRASYRTTGDRLHAVKSSEHAWWQAIDNCGCGDACPHEPDEDGDVECECEHYGLPPCGELYSFKGLVCAPDAPGALPVITMEVEVR